MHRGRLRSAIHQAEANEDVFRVNLRIFDKAIEVAVFIENTCVEQFEFKPLASAMAVFLDEPSIGVWVLGIFVEILHVRVGGR